MDSAKTSVRGQHSLKTMKGTEKLNITAKKS